MNKYQDTIKKEFNEIAEDYANEAYISGQTLQSVERFLEYLPRRGKILDVGCGGGQDSQQFRNAGYKVIGIDLSERMIRLAKMFARKVKFIHGNFLEVKFRKKYFIAVWCMRVFLLVPFAEQEEFIKKAYSILKPGGYLFLSAKSGPTDSEGIDERGKFRKVMTQDSLEALLKRWSFEIVAFQREGGWMEVICKK